MENQEPIAITGIGCRFPGGSHGPDAFWNLLRNGVDAIVEIPADRWSISAFYDSEPTLPGKTNSRWGGFLEGIDQFDPAFFGISPREAAQMDPQQRLLLETAWEAVEDAGFVTDAAEGSRTGVFVGISTFDYSQIQTSFRDKTSLEAHSTTGSVLSIAANRLSYFLNFHGPSLVVDTACSSSLVAVHLACQSLRNGECFSALAGGVNAILTPDTFIGFSQMSMLSPDGRCKAFDARGNGFVRGEGAGVVVLKPLSAAQADGDRIYAVIRGSAVNQDGRTSSLTVPGSKSQERLIREACRNAGVHPHEIDYIEAHGTGTEVGDPIEANAIGSVIGQNRAGGKCVMGSVKTNIGHLEAGSGIAGLIKTTLLLHHGEIPPNLHFEVPNPNIDFEKCRLRVPVAIEDLPRKDALAAINSFGFGGTNAHAILQSVSPPKAATSAQSDPPCLFVVSARHEESLRALASTYATWLGATPQALGDICSSLATRRVHHPHRIAIAANAKADVIAKLEAFLAGETRPGLSAGVASPRKGVVFVFSGQGPQWWAMGRELLATHQGFQKKISECDSLFGQWADWSLLEEMSRDEAASRMDLPSIAQPAIFALQLGLAEWWRENGVEPAAVIGHSVGEAAAAHLCGALDLPSAAKVIFERGRCMQLIPPRGKMLAIALSPDAVVPWMGGLKRVEIAAINSPRSITISGDPSALEQMAGRLESASIWCRFLRVNYAFHSEQMEPARRALKAALREITPQAPAMPICSTVTGKLSGLEKFDADYWWRNVRQPVQFAGGIKALIEAGFTSFLEIGPHPVLAGSISECLRACDAEAGLVVHSLRRGEPESAALLGSLGTLHASGVPVRWPAGGRAVDLPRHPWAHSRHWHEAAESISSRLAALPHPLLGRTLDTTEPVWEMPINLALLPYLNDHRLNGRGVFPAAAYVEMALGAGLSIHEKLPLILEEIEFDRALFLPGPEQSTRLEFRCQSEDGSFRIHSRTGRTWTPHCRGKIRSGNHTKLPRPAILGEIQARCPEKNLGADSYERFQKNGFHFGESFRGVSRVWRRDGEALGEISAPEILKTDGYSIHPALLDSCFQVVLSALTPEESSRGLFLPVRIDQMRFFSAPNGRLWSHVRLAESGERTISAQIRLLDDSGAVLATIDGFRCKAIDQPAAKVEEIDRCFYEIAWHEAEQESTEPMGAMEDWLLVGREGSIPSDFAAQLGSPAIACARANVAELGTRLAGSSTIRHVIYFARSSQNGDANSASAVCLELLEVVQKLAAIGDDLRLSVITRCAQPVDEIPVCPGHGALLGLGRVVQNEHPRLHCRLIDLGADDAGLAIDLFAEELRGGSETEVALRGRKRFVPRLGRVSPKLKCLTGAEIPFRLEVVKPGVLDQLEFRRMTRSSPGEGEIEVEVVAAGLNFRDVMKALGIYPIERPVDQLLGDECAGRVLAAGRGVAHLRKGDEVIVISQGCFSKYITVPSSLAALKPAHLTFEEAVTIPVTFLTAHYALHHLARIQRGERVLIHAAAGGVGLAAVQIARLAGAEIFATAGSDEKRALVRTMGVTHVMDSRSLDFADEVMEITGGEGVDIVLNSLAGEAIPKSLSVLRPYGRFLEIGKRDIYQNSRLGLRPFSKNLSFFALDLSQLLRDRPAFIERTLDQLMRQFQARELLPLPHRLYPLAQAAEAFREMASGKHSGKIVFSLASSVPIQPARDEKASFREDATYLITGGVGGFGLAVAEWMIGLGARNLVLLGSRQASAQSAAAHFAGSKFPGVDIHAKAVDVSDPIALAELFSEIRETMPPLAGVIHAAMKLDDGILLQQTAERFEKVMAPKAGGAWNLHLQTLELPLDFFVMFSSVASLIGNPGQGNYAAANAYLDALADYRQARGLPALTVNWGHLGGAGFVSRNSQISEHLVRHGIPELALPEALGLLGKLLRSDVARSAAMRIDWPRWAEANPQALHTAKFREILALEISDQQAVAAGGISDAILAASGVERLKLLETYIRETAARVLGMPASKLDPAQPLTDFGLDSLMSVELVNRMEDGLQVRFPVEKIVGGPSIKALSKILAESLPPPSEERTAGTR